MKGSLIGGQLLQILQQFKKGHPRDRTQYRVLHAGEPAPVEQHFVKVVNEVKALEKIKKPRKNRRTEAQ